MIFSARSHSSHTDLWTFLRVIFQAGTILRLTVAAILILIALPHVGAQTVIVSNLTATSNGTLSISTTQSVAGGFTTGSTSSAFNGVTIALGSASGASSVFTVALYSSTSGLPGTLLQTLSGPSSPQPAGNYTYTVDTPLTLAPGTTYFWVGSLASPSSTDRRRSLTTASLSQTSSDGWTINDSYYAKSSSGTWNTGSTPSMFSVSISAIPEPSTYAALAGAAMLGFACYRRHARK